MTSKMNYYRPRLDQARKTFVIDFSGEIRVTLPPHVSAKDANEILEMAFEFVRFDDNAVLEEFTFATAAIADIYIEHEPSEHDPTCIYPLNY